MSAIDPRDFNPLSQLASLIVLFILSGVAILAVIGIFGCGKIIPEVPTLDEFLKGKKVKCTVKVIVPPGKREGEEFVTTDAELSDCHEVKP